MRVRIYLVSLALVIAASAKDEIGARQLQQFLNEHKEPAGILRTSYGYPVTYKEANLGINRDSSFLLNPYNYESTSSFSLERIPPRAVHANGCGAKGYFEVTHDVTNITNIKFFNTIGKKTPILVRFSTSAGEIGSDELGSAQRSKGFAIKFYTEEGNMDLIGFAVDATSIKNPVFAPYFIHSFKPNPKTGLLDSAVAWDFIAQHPSGLYAFIQAFSKIGQPRGYRFIPGHAVHTFQVENDAGKTSFVKFNWFPDAGIQTFSNQELLALVGTNPDLHTEDLYDAIANKTYPSWTLCIQVASKADIKKVKYDLFDVTMNWPEEDFPNIPIGKFVLNKHVQNHFAEVEQASFNPANLVPGVRGLDKLFEARTFIYRDGAIHRMGIGYNKIKVNCPINNPKTYNRDGSPPLGDNGGESPNYYPNSFNGIVPVNKTWTPRYRPITDPGTTSLWQVAKFYNDMPEEDKQVLVSNIGRGLAAIPTIVKDKILKIFAEADTLMASKIKSVVTQATASSG